MKRQSMEERAGRYVVLVHHYGHGFEMSRKDQNLPRILTSAINQVMFGPDHKLRIPIIKVKQYLNYCIECYRDYYRTRQQNLFAEG